MQIQIATSFLMQSKNTQDDQWGENSLSDPAVLLSLSEMADALALATTT